MSTMRPSRALCSAAPHEVVESRSPRLADLPLAQPGSAVISAYYGFRVGESRARRYAASRRASQAHSRSPRRSCCSRSGASGRGSCDACVACRWRSTSASGSLFYVVIIVVGLVVARCAGRIGSHSPSTRSSRASFTFAVAMVGLANIAIEMGHLLGFSTLKNLLTGRYVRPRREAPGLPADRHEELHRRRRAARPDPLP